MERKLDWESRATDLSVIQTFSSYVKACFFTSKLFDSSARGGVFSIFSALINYIPLSLKGVIHFQHY